MKTRTTRFGVFLLLIMLVLPFAAQDNLAAVMLVQSDGVMVQRVGTNQFLPVTTEAIVGVGDTIRTDETGRALITFFADGVDTTLEPGTEYRIDVFQGESDTFQLTVSVLVGQTSQRLERVLDPASNYDVNTPGVDLAARGTAFDVRVEQGGRSAMIVTEGVVAATKEEQDAEVPVGFGIRAAVGGALSNVVVATTFAELDAAIDGCTAALTTPDDVRINVRTGASLDFPVAGTVLDVDITNLKGVTADGDWYRIDFRGGFGWILSSSVEIQGECAGLRQFESGAGPEDASLYEFIGDPITLEDLMSSVPESTPEATESE